jgi:hypothetical protein
MGGKKLIAEIDKEIGVFKIEQHAQVNNNAQPKQELLAAFIFPAVYHVGQNVVDNG